MDRSSRTARSRLDWIRLGVGLAVLAVLLALTSYALLTYTFSRQPGSDVSAYWEAAERLRSGEPLYVAGAANAPDLYRYAPWFAAAWIPFTLLPRDAVTAAWVGLMLAAALISLIPLLRAGLCGWAALAIFAPTQIEAAIYGNVQPLLVLMLLWGVERRSGPLWIALGASLKAVPLVLAIVYAGRGEWGRAALTLGLTVLLVAPTLLFDLSGYSINVGPRQESLAGVSAFLFVPVAAAAVVATWLLARTRFAWLAGGLAMILTLPRYLDYQIGFLLVGLARRPRSPSRLP
jgi:Glycosyltransferase family 87